MSTGEEKDLILLTRSVSSCMEKIDGQKHEWRGEEMRGRDEGIMLALTSLLLSTKKERKLLQSLFDQTGTSGGAGVTVLLIVSNRTQTGCAYWWR